MREVVNFFTTAIDFVVSLLGGPSMLKFLLRRILAALPVLFAIMVVTFGLSQALPGGPFDTVNQRPMPEHIRQQLEERYGLNKSLFFDQPTNANGAETVWGKQAFVKGGFGEVTEGTYEALKKQDVGNTGISIYSKYELYRWDDATQSYIRYAQYPYSDWARNNADLTATLSTLSAFASSLSGLPASGLASTGSYLSANAITNQSLNALETFREDCRPYRQWPGWALVAKREECITTGGSRSGAVTNKAESVVRIDALDSQFWNYFWNVLHLDFGPSLNIAQLQENRQVADEINDRLPVSMKVGVIAVIFGFSLGIPLGVLAAIYHNTVIDYIATFFAIVGQSTPTIVLAPLLIIIFAVELKLLPTPERNVWSQSVLIRNRRELVALILPTLALGAGMSAGIARLTRASLLQVLNEDYIRTARAKGLRERTVVYLHALKNSLIPVATILGPLLAAILTGTFVVELIFLIPGLGGSFINSVAARDYTTIMAVTLLYSVFLVIGNIMVDVMYTWLDPRIRFD
jgi:oligopeptide transport system permease protein